MAGPFTHILLCQCAADPTQAEELKVPKALPKDLYILLNQYRSYRSLGSLAPDLPAIDDQVWGLKWSDQMHDGALRHAVVKVFAELQKAPCTDAAVAWVFGYVGHIVGDVAVHPVVGLANKARGNKAHRECEICQDSLIFMEQTGADLITAQHLDDLKACRQDLATYDQILAAWSAGLKQQDAKFDDSCLDWYGTYLAGIHAATTQSTILTSNLHFLLGNYAYRAAKDIDSKDKKAFYTEVALPSPIGARGNFKQQVFDLGVRKLIELWGRMWERWQAKQAIDDLIPDWNLNTGQDMSTGKLAFWP